MKLKLIKIKNKKIQQIIKVMNLIISNKYYIRLL